MDRKRSPHTALVQMLQEGSISLPVVLFTQYKRLGLSEGEVMLLIHIMLYQEKEGKSFPTVSELEERMSVSADQVVRWLQSLVRGGFLSIDEEVTENGIHSERYSTRPLLQQLAAAYLEGEVPDMTEEEGEEDVYGRLFQTFEQEFGRPLSPMECETLSHWIDQDGYSTELILAALREAVFSNKLNFRYIDRILLEWQRNRIQTPEEAIEYAKKFHQKGVLYQSTPHQKKDGFSFYNWVNQN
ncbi:DnaD domain-containing protein [Polycladomyces sp. WAk]|uniref:DnaD domain-containing protein n=1 Tax=Polycladomyces zharkentensis TaxID=2807616 RepID=A0ABS2WJ08_9BACL|nr:DnaD domain-containing protein [Polycladomyces sp. WAk]MBN2909455.1 DnaD domain-containing protein [Polycladomyces sp. WAk]